MEATRVIAVGCVIAVLAVGLFLFWRYYWFFRNPARIIPNGQNIVSAADGTVVYVKRVKPEEEVLCVKQGVPLKVQDIVRHDVNEVKLVIGVFMSPFDVHFNRIPLTGVVDFIRRHPATPGNRNMGWMHLRTLLGLEPYYHGSRHIAENERAVTRIEARFKGERISYYLVQIAGKSVNGIESFVREGESVTKGQIFGIIKIGSQVDLVLPYRDAMTVKIKPGDRVYAGESILVE
jgi:phosphatidylserine decarboxylase